MHTPASFIRLRRFVAAAVSLGWVIGLAPLARSQSPPPAPTPKFDSVESPITADELAKELGYKFYGNTWKFSVPTYVRVKVWSEEGSAADVPEQPPASADWDTFYCPDKPQKELTLHILEKTDKDKAADDHSAYTDVTMHFSIDASGKDAPDESAAGKAPSSGILPETWDTSEGAGTSLSLDFMQGPHQNYETEWRYANGHLGVLFESVASAIEDAAAHPDRPDQSQAAEAAIRAQAEAAMRAAPLNVCYFKGEIRSHGEAEPGKDGASKPKDVPKKRAVCLIALECSREPFKDAAASNPPAAPDAKVAAGH